MTVHDPRYLAGIAHFNAGEYFEAHEVWEALWRDCPDADRPFYLSLIQAAVALYHQERGNTSGADRLCRSGRMKVVDTPRRQHGLPLDDFWDSVESYVAELRKHLNQPDSFATIGPIRPMIVLGPEAI